MRKKIVAGNWKMNLDNSQASELFNQLNKIPNFENVEIVIAPAHIYLSRFSQNKSNIILAAQDVSENDNGAYTGDISSTMLSSINIKYCLVGHSERRNIHKETDGLIFKKAKALLKNGITPIFCCGESIEERNNKQEYETVRKQLSLIINNLSEDEILNTVIAYEPVWAIGTGLTASSKDAQLMHNYIRSLIEKKFSNNISSQISILYGGSCKPDNSKELFSQKDIDGGLIGGASLNADSFISIVNSF